MNEEKIMKQNIEKIEIEIKKSAFAKPWVQSITGVVVIVILFVVFVFWRILSNEIKIENSKKSPSRRRGLFSWFVVP